MAGIGKLRDMDITKDELNQIGEALKQKEFRQLLVDYVEEINDPENKKKFQEEVTQLEKERGYDVTFINPEPGYVIKTSVDGEAKAFINICKSDKLQTPTSVTATKDGSCGQNWSLPYSQAPPREDIDKAGNMCTVFDVVFHPQTIKLAESNSQFKNIVNNTALEAVEKSFNVKLDRKNIKFPKMKYKGGAFPTLIRKKSASPPPKTDDSDDDDDELLAKIKYPYQEPSDYAKEYASRKKERKSNNTVTPDESPYTTPNYSIKHRNAVDMQEYTNDKNAKLNITLPKEIIIEIELPLLSSTSEAILDVTEKSLALVSEKPAKYKLNITLPYTVDEEAGNAKFDKAKRKLNVTLPLRYRRETRFADFGREDSGVESDLGQHTPESSSGDDDSVSRSLKSAATSIQVESEDKHPECNEETKTEPLVSVLDSEVFRTNQNKSCVFLNPEHHYSFPLFTCNVVDNTIVFTLHVKNVDPNSMNHYIFEDSSGIHVKFTSIGSGFFPIHHAFCTKFPQSSSIAEDSVNVETWDNNVIVQIQFKTCDINLSEYLAGVDEDSLVKHDLPEPTLIEKQLEELKEASETSEKDPNLNIEVTKLSKDETVIEITPTSLFHSDIGRHELKSDEKSSVSSEDSAFSDEYKRSKHPMLEKCRRTLSESSGDELSFSPTRKGILKRVSRSLSESSADDYSWSSPVSTIAPFGSDSCIPEEEGKGSKKTVRFNEIVHQKTFRTNSSILGQRKKNQRKMRNKKRAQERRASESETSEGESDKQKGGDNKTEKSEEEEDEEDETNLDEFSVGNEASEEVFETETKLQDEKVNKSNKYNGTGQSQVKGKKKGQKTMETSKDHVSAAKVDLKNDLIFDLDM